MRLREVLERLFRSWKNPGMNLEAMTSWGGKEMYELPSEPDDPVRQQAVIQRESMAIDSILENENLTADLEDEAANSLIDWGVNWAKRNARATSGMDDARAEATLSDRMRATRQLMRSIDLWVADRENMAPEGHAEMLAQVTEQAAAAYGDGFMPPDAARCQAFLEQIGQFSGFPKEMVVQLSSLFSQPD